jgi:hypothetical protein
MTGECAGACMVPTDVCRPFNNGECRCQPPRRTCAMNDNGQCGGACPSAGDVCLPTDDDTCECQPPPATGECGRDRETRECAGDCPDGLVCVPHSNGVCRCESPDGCTLDPMSGQCGGMCPKGKECRTQETPAGTFCRCVGPQAKLRGPRD